MGTSSSKPGFPITLTGAPGNYGTSWVGGTSDNKSYVYRNLPIGTSPPPLPKDYVSVTGDYSTTDNSMLVSVYMVGQANPVQIKMDNCSVTPSGTTEIISCAVDTQSQQQLQALLSSNQSYVQTNPNNNSNVLFWLLLLIFVLLVFFLFFKARRH